MADLVRAKTTRRVPVVLTRDEVRSLLGHMRGVPQLVARLLYGTGVRLLEALCLRVKDVDFGLNEITVRRGKGDRDRVTMLPESLRPALRGHLQAVRLLHDRLVAAGGGFVGLPGALAAKYPSAGREWGWQWVFPASRDQWTRGLVRRAGSTCTRASSSARSARLKRSGIPKPAHCHTLRHSFATHLLEAGYDIRSRVGDHRERVLQLYGAPRKDDGDELTYEDPDQPWPSIVVRLKGDRVASVFIGYFVD